MDKTILPKLLHVLHAYGHSPGADLYIREDSHNISVTDKQTFFAKVLGDHNDQANLVLEALASKHIPEGSQLLQPEIVSIEGTIVTVWKYLKGVTPEIDDLTEEHVTEWMRKLALIRQVQPVLLPNLKGFAHTSATIRRRLDKTKQMGLLNKDMESSFEQLIEAFVTPVENHNFRNAVICHSDVHTGNLMILENGELIVIDYESLKLVPAEFDLAGIYQQFVQIEQRKEVFDIVQAAFAKTTPLDKDLLDRLILLRNVSTATYALSKGEVDVAAQRVDVLKRSATTMRPPETLSRMSA